MASELVADSSASPLAKKRWTAVEIVKGVGGLERSLGRGPGVS